MKVVILAGGGGTRLWPMSRKDHPKQFLRLFGDATLLELARKRLGDDFADDDVYYSVTEETAPFVRELYPKVDEAHLIIEPEKRDTGPAMGYAAAVLAIEYPNEPIAFLPSDHFIRDHDRFRRSLHVADELIRETGCLLDIGVTPTWPNTGLGYTHIGERKQERYGIEVFAFKGHTEKPPADQAKAFLASGEYLWHGNYYMWTPQKFLDAYKQHAPETYATLVRIQELVRKKRRKDIAEEYAKLEKISIDFAITEKLDPSNVLIIKASFDWSDVGLWSVLKELRQENPEDNVVSGTELIGIDSEDCLVYGQKDKVVGVVGLKGIIVVDTGDALLVCAKDRSGEVKEIVRELDNRNKNQYL